MIASILAMKRMDNRASIRKLPRGSGLFSIRFEERPLDHRRRSAVALPLDRDLDLHAGPDLGVRCGDGRDCEVFFQQGRPAAARCPSDLSVSGEDRHLLSPRIRATSRASMPAGVMSYPAPFVMSASQSASARSRSTQISYPRSPVYPVREIWTGMPSNFVFTNRKYFIFWTAPSAPSSRIARDDGPCKASAPISSDTSVTVTSRPIPASCNHFRFGSADVIRNDPSPKFQSVPSSTVFPRSSHQGV